ncbi:MAG: 3-phosphoshikimate 1-carboxyvinyltransferase [Acidaminococcaceae bacterium]
MDTIRIKPTTLAGKVYIPSSKSMGHREIICAALAEGTSVVDNISMSADIEATCRALEALGTRIIKVSSKYPGRTAFKIDGGILQVVNKEIDCGESGSTLRFMIPIAALCGDEVTFRGHGKLVSRPLDAYYDIFAKQGFAYETAPSGELPLKLQGKLASGEFELPGNVSSQFISGLLFALPLLEGDSVITITSPLESQSYVELTLSCLAKYGIEIEHENYLRYRIRGGQQYIGRESVVEGDYSQAAFWLVAGALGGPLDCMGLTLSSLQGDKAIIEIMAAMGARINIDEANMLITSSLASTKATIIDASDCPDIIPVLAVLAAVSEGTTEIINAGRLRIKECDRLKAVATELGKLGADITELADGLVIKGRKLLAGGEVECWNDHRIAMSLAIASCKCQSELVVHGTESVRKSYPKFWEDFVALGGQIERVR